MILDEVLVRFMSEGRNYASIGLEHAEVLELIDSEVWLRMASIDHQGQIWNIPTHYVRIGNTIYFDEEPDSILINNLETSPSVNAVVDTGYSYDDVKGVILPGTVSTVDDREVEDLVALEIKKKYTSLTGRPPLQDFKERVILKFELPECPESLSWHYGKKHF